MSRTGNTEGVDYVTVIQVIYKPLRKKKSTGLSHVLKVRVSSHHDGHTGHAYEHMLRLLGCEFIASNEWNVTGRQCIGEADLSSRILLKF